MDNIKMYAQQRQYLHKKEKKKRKKREITI